MVDHGKVRSAVKPPVLALDDFSVWKSTDIQEITENAGTDAEFKGFEYHLVQYTKDEFILEQAQTNATLEQSLTDTQLALCDVYEMIG